LGLIVRSHEFCDGISLNHGGKVVTIFSASFYCGTNNNHGKNKMK